MQLLWVGILFLLFGCDRCGKSSPPAAGSLAVPDASASSGAHDALSALKWDDTPLDWSRPVPETPAGGVAEAGYVGSEACKDCHKDLYTSYARHSMARTGLRTLASLDQKWLARIFDAGSTQPVTHERSGFIYRPVRKGNDYFVEEQLPGADGTPIETWLQPITYAYSAGSYGMAFYFRQGTHFFQVPLDYYARAERWGMDPSYVEGNVRFSKVLRAFCISCHGDYPRRRAGTDDVFLDPVPTGIGCERCHGPGAKHVQTLSAADIVNPARLAPAHQLDVCVQCHESNTSTLRADRDEFSFRPGEPVSKYRVNFVGDPPEPDRFILLAHPERMVRSACWKASGGKLVCTSCHDPHRSSFDQPASWWDAKCNACHADKPCTETAQEREKQGGHCIPCHMRSGPPTSPQLVTITDHWIQRRPPPVRPGSDKPTHVVPWPELVGDPAPGLDLDAAEAVALARDGQPAQAEHVAAAVVESRAHAPELLDWLAGHYAEARQPWNSARALAAILRFEPNAQETLHGYARLMLDRGPPGVPEAMHALDRMLALDPDDPSALETKGMYLFRSGRVDEARPIFARAAANGPMSAASHVALGALAKHDGHDAEGIAELELARRIEPSDGWILDQLGAAYGQTGDAARAAIIERSRRFFASKGGIAPTNATRWLPNGWR